MNGSIDIRLASINDTPKMSKVHMMSFKYAHKGQLPESFFNLIRPEMNDVTWRQIMGSPDTLSFVALIGKKIVGLVTVNIKLGNLYALYVAPSYMKKGIGSALLQTGLNKLSGFPQVNVWVMASNEAAKKWYENKGFVLTGETREQMVRGVLVKDVEMLKTFVDNSKISPFITP